MGPPVDWNELSLEHCQGMMPNTVHQGLWHTQQIINGDWYVTGSAAKAAVSEYTISFILKSKISRIQMIQILLQ